MEFKTSSKNLVFSATRCCKSDVCDLRSLIEDACGDDDHEDQDGHDIDQMMTPMTAIMTKTSHPLPSFGGVEAVSLPRNILPKLALPKRGGKMNKSHPVLQKLSST